MGEATVQTEPRGDSREAAIRAATRGVPEYMREQVARKVGAQWDKATAGDPIANIAKAGEKNTKENKAAIDKWAKGAQKRIDKLGDKANQSDKDMLAQLAQGGQLAGEAQAQILKNLQAGNSGPIDYGAQQDDVTSQAAGAFADPDSIAAQKEAIDKYRGLTDPTVTAKEKFLMMQSRVGEEQSRKSAMDAALQDMQRRGVRSGGAEMSALLGAQQTTSQNRLMQDLGTQAGAVDRSMQAIEGLGRVSGEARGQSFDESFKTGGAADQIAMFNTTQGANYQRDLAEFKAGERDAAWGRTTDISDQASKNVDDYMVRLKDQTTLGMDATQNTFGRGIDSVGVGRDAIGMKVGAGNQGFQTFAEAEKLRIAKEEASKAAAALKPKGFFESGGGPLGLW
jgi:hypothetical protein